MRRRDWEGNKRTQREYSVDDVEYDETLQDKPQNPNDLETHSRRSQTEKAHRRITETTPNELLHRSRFHEHQGRGRSFLDIMKIGKEAGQEL